MYDKNRPSIPAELRRSVLIRAGHSCEITGCIEKTYVDIHHIDCNRENNVIGNLIALCGTHHRMAHEGKIDRKSLIGYTQKNASMTYTHANEVARVLIFLDKIKLCLTEYDNGYPENVGSELYYFFTKSVYNEMYNFIDSGIYQRELRSFDTSALTKQDKIVVLINEIIQSVTIDKYYELNLVYKLAGNHPHGPERDKLIESQNLYINSRLKEVFRLLNELEQYCLAR